MKELKYEINENLENQHKFKLGAKNEGKSCFREKEEQLKQLKNKHSESWKKVFECESDTLGPWGQAFCQFLGF